MPIYEYECAECGEQFERIFMTPDERPEEMSCPECGSDQVQRVFSAPSIVGGATDTTEKEEQASGQPRSFGGEDLNQALKKQP